MGFELDARRGPPEITVRVTGPEIDVRPTTLADLQRARDAVAAATALAVNLLRKHYSAAQRAAFVSSVATITHVDAGKISRKQDRLNSDGLTLLEAAVLRVNEPRHRGRWRLQSPYAHVRHAEAHAACWRESRTLEDLAHGATRLLLGLELALGAEEGERP
jgi:hypothetical protein